MKGLKGGHSGDDIQKGLANANKLITRILWKAAHDFDLRINNLEAGNLRNAIAREGYAIVAIPEAKSKILLLCRKIKC